jgi:serine/threonine protein kinase
MLNERILVNECYILQNRLGEDSYTEHWTANTIFTATKFLLRFLKNNATISNCLDDFQAEARKYYSIRGQTIADFFEFGAFENRLFISSEYHNEKNLLAILKEKKRWRLDEIYMIILSLSRSLAAFHDQGVVYGNLNAENILIEMNGEQIKAVKIQKPSLLSLLPSLSDEKNSHFENYAYIAPEFKRRNELTQRSDVYSIGVHLVRLITGRLPFNDSPQSIRSNSASLRFATNALFRRGIPEELTRISLRALMPDPDRRYRNCSDLIADLCIFMDSLETSGLSSANNASTGPEIFNPGNSIQTEARVYRSIDTAKYFRSLTNPSKEIETESIINFSIKDFSDDTAIKQLEEQELSTNQDEPHWSIDDYITFGYHAVPGKKSGNKVPTGDPPIKPEAAKFLGRAPVQDAAQEVSKKTETPAAFTPGRAENTGTGDKSSTGKSGQSAIDTQNSTKSNTGSSQADNHIDTFEIPQDRSVHWNFLQFPSQDVPEIIVRSAIKARRGKGQLTYIYEPSLDVIQAAFVHLLETLNKNFMYISIEATTNLVGINIVVFLRLLRNGISLALRGETKNAIKRLSRLVAREDVFGVFKSAPLGHIFYGIDKNEITGVQINSLECQESIVRSLLSLGRKKRPLVIVLRGGEKIRKELHELFMLIAKKIGKGPACMFIFFENTDCKPWQEISYLYKNQKSMDQS